MSSTSRLSAILWRAATFSRPGGTTKRHRRSRFVASQVSPMPCDEPRPVDGELADPEVAVAVGEGVQLEATFHDAPSGPVRVITSASGVDRLG